MAPLAKVRCAAVSASPPHSQEHRRLPRAVSAVALLVLLAWALAPFLPLLDVPPLGRDALWWIDNGSPGRPGWLHWILLEQHFVGYRPLTAASYALVQGLFGYEPGPQRTLDLALAALGAGLLYRLAGRWGAGSWSLLAPAVLLLHPAIEEILLHLDRRSYLLALCLGAGALLAQSRSRLASAALWLLAVASNEVALVPVLALPLLDGGGGGWRERAARAWRQHALTWVLVGLFGLLRTAVLGHLGGYGGVDLVRTWDPAAGIDSELAPLHAGLLAAASGLYQLVLAPAGDRSPSPLGAGPLGLFLAGAAAILVAWGARATGPRGRFLGAWLVGLLLVAAIDGTWFWRMCFALVVPGSLLVALVAASSASRTSVASYRWPLALLLANALASSHAVQGIRSGYRQLMLQRRDQLLQAEELAHTLAPGSRLYHLDGRGVRKGLVFVDWLRLRLDGRVEPVLVGWRRAGAGWGGVVRVEEDGVRAGGVLELSEQGRELFGEDGLLSDEELPPGRVLTWGAGRDLGHWPR